MARNPTAVPRQGASARVYTLCFHALFESFGSNVPVDGEEVARGPRMARSTYGPSSRTTRNRFSEGNYIRMHTRARRRFSLPAWRQQSHRHAVQCHLSVWL